MHKKPGSNTLHEAFLVPEFSWCVECNCTSELPHARSLLCPSCGASVSAEIEKAGFSAGSRK